jgi:hypothetical protein
LMGNTTPMKSSPASDLTYIRIRDTSHQVTSWYR